MIDRGLGQWKVVVTDGGGKADVWVMADQKHANQFAEEMLDSGYKKVFVRFFPNPPLPKEHKWFVTGYLGPTFLGARGFTTKSKARTFASDLRKTGCSNVEVHEVVTLLMDAPRGSRDQYAGAPPKPFKPRKPSGTPPYGEGSADFVRRALLPILQGLLEGSGWSAELVKDKT